MKQVQFEAYARANAVGKVFTSRGHVMPMKLWTAVVYDHNGEPLTDVPQIIDARGNFKTWASLDTLHDWFREQGYDGSIVIEC